MRIFYSPDSDPLIVDSVGGLNGIHERVRRFLASEQHRIQLDADVTGDPAPYSEFLSALAIEKADGPIVVTLDPSRILRVRGATNNLALYMGSFRFREDEDGSHHHPENVALSHYISPGTLRLIVEADGTYISKLRNGI